MQNYYTRTTYRLDGRSVRNGLKMEGALDLVGNHFFEGASFLISAGALLYAVLAFRVAKRAVAAAEASDLISLKLKAREGRDKAERSLMLLQAACCDMRSRWSQHHDRHYPMLGARDYRRDDTRHIFALENEGRELLKAVEVEMTGLGAMSSEALEDYIERTDGAAIKIERLILNLSPPKQLFA